MYVACFLLERICTASFRMHLDYREQYLSFMHMPQIANSCRPNEKADFSKAPPSPAHNDEKIKLFHSQQKWHQRTVTTTINNCNVSYCLRIQLSMYWGICFFFIHSNIIRCSVHFLPVHMNAGLSHMCYSTPVFDFHRSAVSCFLLSISINCFFFVRICYSNHFTIKYH